MNTLSQITELKDKNIRCYYIDSDGDEVIVSDEEDFEVAFEYVKAKGEGKVNFFPTKRQDDSDDEDFKQPEMQSKDSLKHVADTVSVEGNDDDDSSEPSDDGIQEIDASTDLRKEFDGYKEFDKRLDDTVQDTFSRESSIYRPQKDSHEKDFSDNLLTESQVRCDEEEKEDGVLQTALSLSKTNSDNIVDQFDVIQSRVHDYNPRHELVQDILHEKVEKAQPHVEGGQEDQLESYQFEEYVSDEKVSDSPNFRQTEASIQRESNEEQQLLDMNKSAESFNESPEEDEKKEELEEEQKEEFVDEPRMSVAMSCAKANVIREGNPKKVKLLQKALDSINFVFTHPDKRLEIAELDESEEEKSQEYVITCKPGKVAKKRWRIINNSRICWPKRTVLQCQNEDADVELPDIQTALMPGEKLDISVNIRIKEDEKENIVKVFVFRFYNHIYGHFGVPLIATVEVTPDLSHQPAKEYSQEEKLQELLEGDEINPILYEIANDFVEEGLGNFQQCLEALLQ